MINYESSHCTVLSSLLLPFLAHVVLILLADLTYLTSLYQLQILYNGECGAKEIVNIE